MYLEETICALATSGSGALAVMRLSGPMSIQIGDSFFFSPGKKKLTEMAANTVHFGEIRDGTEVLDQVLVSVFKAPNSYTGEDSLEISCHASPYIEKRILELMIENGAKLAGPGEFTKRAFLNGKMDLSQAEAVADLISAESKSAHRVAMNQLKGGFSRELAGLRNELLKFATMIELELDFSEEDVEFASRKSLNDLVINMLNVINELIGSFRNGNVIKNGVPVAIIGKPNVGKSSLLNRLLREDRAIVSEIPGTTRDSIEDTIRIHDITFRFIDTAGIRETSDIVENLGINRTFQKIEQAAIILLLTDAREEPDEIAETFHEIRNQTLDSEKQLVLVLNKSDLLENSMLDELNKVIHPAENEYIVEISAKKGINIDRLDQILLMASRLGDFNKDSVIVSNIRHYEALSRSSESLERVREGLISGISSDLIAQDLRQAIHFIGEITGEITTDEVLGNIFKNFCIGK